MRIIRFTLLSFLVLVLFAFAGCGREDCCSHYSYFFFEKYFAPSDAAIKLGANNCFVSLYSDDYVEGMDNSEFRKLAAEYGEMGRKRILIIGIPYYRKPYNIQGIIVWQGEGAARVDVSAEVLIDYSDYSGFISSGYEGRHYQIVRRTLSELTDYDLKWVSEGFYLSFDQLENRSNLVLEVSVKGRAPIIKRFRNALSEGSRGQNCGR